MSGACRSWYFNEANNCFVNIGDNKIKITISYFTNIFGDKSYYIVMERFFANDPYNKDIISINREISWQLYFDSCEDAKICISDILKSYNHKIISQEMASYV